MESVGRFYKSAADDSVWAWKLARGGLSKKAQRKVVNDTAKATAFFFREACVAYTNGLVKTADVFDGSRMQQMPVVHSPAKNRRDRSGLPSTDSKGKREIGYSAQAFAAEQLYHEVVALNKQLDLAIRPEAARDQYTKVRSTLQSIASEFASTLRNSTVGMLDKAAKHLLSTMPAFEDSQSLRLWAKTVEAQVKAQVLKLMGQNTVSEQANTLRGFWDKSKDKAFGWLKNKLRGPQGAPPAQTPPQTPPAGQVAAATAGRFTRLSASAWKWEAA